MKFVFKGSTFLKGGTFAEGGTFANKKPHPF
jgi:hypothetical protein